MAITLNGTTGISSPGGDTSTSLATTNLSYTGTLTGGTGVIAIGTNQIYKDASGNVGLGVTPSVRLNVQAATANATVANFSGSNSGRGLTIKTFQSLGGDDCGVDFSAFASPYGSFKWTQSASTVMTLDASGNLSNVGNVSFNTGGLATYLRPSGTAYTQIGDNQTLGAGTSFVIGSSPAYLGFITAGTERARIDSSGNLLVGTTASLGKVTISSSTNSGHLYLTGAQQNAIQFTTAAGGAGFIIGRSSSADNANNFFVYDNSVNSTRMLLDVNGYLTCLGVYNNAAAATNAVNVNSSGVVYRSTSSRKYKEEILDADFGLADVLKLRPITYASKNKDISGDRRFGGLIAEEVDEAGLGIFVEYADDGSPDNVHYGNMVSLAFKAIQELSAKVTALEAK